MTLSMLINQSLGDSYLLGIDDSTALLSVQGLGQSRAEDDSEDEEGIKGLHCQGRCGEAKGSFGMFCGMKIVRKA